MLLLIICAASAFAQSINIDLDVPDVTLPKPAKGRPTLSSTGPQRIERIAISGFSSYVSSGDPALPCKTIYIALPPDADPYSLSVVPGSYSTTILDGAYDIGPVPPAAASGGKIDYGPGKQIVAGRNKLVYEVDDYYPAEHLTVSDVGMLRTWKIVALEYWPYAYNPVTGKIRKIQLNHATLSYSTSQYRSAVISDPIAAEMADFVTNRDQALQYYASTTEASIADYVIVTTNAIASTSMGLINFRSFLESRGFHPLIITETDWGGGTGDAAANHIRAWLVNNYLSLGIKYVLLVGNPNPTSGDVPMKLLWPRYDQTSYRDAPSDYFYSDLTGNWDRNGNGYYGEKPGDFGTGGVDRIPDVYVGRVPYYGSISDLDSIFEKIIDYESTIPGDWSRKFILAMKPLDSSTPSYQLGEDIKNNISSICGFDHDRIYDGTYSLSPYPEHYPCMSSTVQNEWINGAGLVFWMTHGSATSATNVFSSDRCPYLNNNTPAIVYGASCENGRPEDSGNLGYSLLLNGAVSTLTASRVSWYYVGESSFTGSDSIGGLGYQYAKYLLTNEESCGRAAMDSRLSVPMYIWSNQLVFNLYGDPSLVFNTRAFGGLSGHIKDIYGYPMPGTIVRSIDGSTTVSSSDGSYRLSGFKKSSLDIVVSADGYYPQRYYDLPIIKGCETAMDFTLVPAITGKITGFVRDSSGAAVSNAKVAILNGDQVAYTASNGSFTLSGIITGEYTLVVTRSPYAQKMVGGCRVTEGGLLSVNITLRFYSDNTVINGGFEDGFTLSVGNQWVKYGSTDYYGTAMVGSDCYKYGSYSQKIRLIQPTTSAYAGFYQVVPTLPGQTYSLVAWARDHFGGTETNPSDNIVCRLGYDLSGDDDPQSSAVVWQEFDPAHDIWHSVFKYITAISPTMTIFLDCQRKLPSGGDNCYAWFDGVSLSGPIESPSAPIVDIDSRHQSGTTSIHATWSCGSADIVDYQYAISKTCDESGIIFGGGWLSAGLDTSATRTGLTLANGDVVRVLVRATNELGATSEIGIADGIRIVMDVESVPVAKLVPDYTWVRIIGLDISRMADGANCFAQEPERRGGIKVMGEWSDLPYMQSGLLADVVGCMSTQDGMRVISQAEVRPTKMGSGVRPLGMPNKQVGGGSFGYSENGLLVGQAGSAWGMGVNNVGLLVRVWGKVMTNDGETFRITDGSLKNGLLVTCWNSASPPAVGEMVEVTGIATPDGVSVYSQEDIETL